MKNISEALAKEQEKLEKLTEQRSALEQKLDALDKKIKKAKDKITQYEMMQNSNQFNAMTNTLAAQGISMDDIMAAVKSGDFFSLQEKMEKAATVTTAVQSDTATASVPDVAED